MNFNQLLIFHKVAELGHFTRAAKELYISQPAVSKQVQELEEYLGQPLFDRIGRKVYLTEAGRILYEYAKRIFALSEEAETELKELQGLRKGKLAVGASTTIGTYLLPELLGAYRSMYPQIELFLGVWNAADIQEKLISNRLDLGLVEGPVTDTRLYRRVWREDELVLIAPPHHPLVSRAADQGLRLDDLFAGNDLPDLPDLPDVQGIQLILREEGSGTRAVLEQALAERGYTELKPAFELGSVEATKRAVAAGLGVAFVSEHTIELEVASGLLARVPISDLKLERPLFLVYLKVKSLSKAARAFLDLIA